MRRSPASAAAALGLALTACARTGFPEGGPEDRSPPAVVVTIPEDRAIDVPTDVQVEIEYGEPLGPGVQSEVRRLVIVNPDRPEVVTNVSGSKIEVQPREPLLPQTTYSVTVLPGVQDRRSNRTQETVRLLFSTGGPLTLTLMRGVVRVGDRTVPGATVRAVNVERELGYRALTDSAGTFELASLATGTYRVTAWNETNGEEGFQFTLEAGDSATADLSRPGSGADLEFDLVLADTSAARALRAEPLARDGLQVTFSDSLDLAGLPGPDGVDLLELAPELAPRGTPLDSVAQAAVRGEAVPVAQVVGDSVDTRVLTLLLAEPLADSTAYAFRARGLRNRAGLVTSQAPDWLLFRTRQVPDSTLTPAAPAVPGQPVPAVDGQAPPAADTTAAAPAPGDTVAPGAAPADTLAPAPGGDSIVETPDPDVPDEGVVP